MSTPTTQIVRRRYDDDALRAIRTADDAAKLAVEIDGAIEDISDILGTGFAVLDKNEKSRLIGIPFLVLDWKFSKGDMGEFASMLVVTRGGEKYIVNDGSTGIADQLRRLGTPRAIKVSHGLRVSEYDVEDRETGQVMVTPTGEIMRAKTFYLAT